MTEKTLEFGLFDIFQVDPNRPTAEILHEHIGHLRYADELGLDYLFIAERHFMPFYRAATPGLILANLAATTKNARMGVLAYTLALHNPILLAEEISALDHLSGGRLEVGIGLGHRPEEIAGLGLPAEHRQAIFLENVVIMRQAWDGQPFDFDGALHHVRNVYVDPPLQKPHPPIWYAGGDPQAAAWAGRNGASLAVGFRPDTALQSAVDTYRAETPPPDAPRQRIALMRNAYIAERTDQAREEIVDDLMRLGRNPVASASGDEGVESEPLPRDEAERQVESMVRDQVMYAGGPEEVAGAISKSLATLGSNVFLANVHFMGVDDARVRRSIRLFAEDVVPRVRAALEESET